MSPLIYIFTLWFSPLQLHAVDTDTGPRSREEPRILWKMGVEAFEAKKYPEALFSLERLVDRYPADPNSLKAHFDCAMSYMELKDYPHALKHLRIFIEAAPIDEISILARSTKGKAYLRLNRFSEALLQADNLIKIQKAYTEKSFAKLAQQEGQLLKASAQWGLKQNKQGLRTADNLIQGFSESTNQNLKQSAYQLRLLLKLQACSLLTRNQPDSEEQAISQFQRRGLCLQESALSLKELFSFSDPLFFNESSDLFRDEVKKYKTAALDPSAPASVQGNHVITYKKELSQNMLLTYQKYLSEIVQSMGSWKANSPAGLGPSPDSMSKFIDQLKSL